MSGPFGESKNDNTGEVEVRCVHLTAKRKPRVLSSSMYCFYTFKCMCVSLHDTQRDKVRPLVHLILDIQRTFLFMEEFQGLHMAVPGCVVDSIGSTLKV